MKNSKVILRFDAVCDSERPDYRLRRLQGTLKPESIIKLIDCADLEANPREAKVGEVTDEIRESLGMADGLFHYKSKGLLIAAADCRALERQRYELKFTDSAFEGILDGGHNMLGIALFILEEAVGKDDPSIKKIKRWQDLQPVWSIHRSAISEVQDVLDFLVPVEVVFPHEGKDGLDAFEGAILDIAQARNNNAELTQETKAHKAGFYDVLKASLDPQIAAQVEWKTNDGGRIKARDLVALSWVPLGLLPKSLPGVKDFNPVTIYSSKGACTKEFNELVGSDLVSREVKGSVREITHEGVKSALALMKDIPRLYDKLYESFPEAYNVASPGFGRIDCVKMYQPDKAADGKKYLRKKPLSKFYKTECVYDYPDGFIMPLVYALSALIEVKGDKVSWKVDPDEFIEENLDEVMKIYYASINMAKYNPQTVGKSSGSYTFAVNAFQFRLK